MIGPTSVEGLKSIVRMAPDGFIAPFLTAGFSTGQPVAQFYLGYFGTEHRDSTANVLRQSFQQHLIRGNAKPGNCLHWDPTIGTCYCLNGVAQCPGNVEGLVSFAKTYALIALSGPGI